MATGVNNSKSVPSTATVTSSATASSSAAAGAASATPSVFRPPADPIAGTWLSLGSYEEVFNSDWDYWAVNKDLKNGGMKLEKILRIHNHHLKDRFTEEQNLVAKGRHSGFNLNIQDLYHGTSENLERICHEGLDERLSTNGHFGRGIYFSDNPAFCRIHSEEKKSSLDTFIVRCKVILGDCKIYPSGSSDPSLNREPVKTTVEGKNVFYDSVQGKPGDFKQYVVYEKRRALIQYVIYYTADGPLPTLPPIPSIASKSTKKKRSKSKERKRSTSPHFSDSQRRSSVSSGDEKDRQRRRSVSSLDGFHSGRSSDAGSVEDDDAAACCSKESFDKSEKNEVRSQTLTDTASEMPKVLTTRARTRRLLNSDSSLASATISLGATSAAADMTSLPSTANSSELASLPSVTTSASAGFASLPIADPNTDAYKKKVQENAMKQMLDLKGKLSDREMQELWQCFSQTYGGVNPLEAQGLSLSSMSSNRGPVVPSGDVDMEAITDVLVEQFQNIAGPIDPALARGYITQFGMDVEKAINAYFESM